MGNNKKFMEVESFMLMAFAVLSDAIGMGLLLFAADDFFILDLLNLFPIGWMMLMKGMSLGEAKLFLVGSGLEVLPYVGALPILTLTMFLNIRRYNHPESAVARIAEKTTGTIGVKRGVKGAPPAMAPAAHQVKNPIGAIPAPIAAPQVVLAKSPTEGYRKTA